jgi:hypothetical protein
MAALVAGVVPAPGLQEPLPPLTEWALQGATVKTHIGHPVVEVVQEVWELREVLEETLTPGAQVERALRAQ